MKMRKEGLSGLLVTDAGDTETGDLSLTELSDSLKSFYAKRGYIVEKTPIDKGLKLMAMGGPQKGIEVTVSQIKNQKHSNSHSGDNTEYYTYVFSARFNGPGEVPFKHRDAFLSEYA